MSSMAEIVDENRLFQQARQRGEETTRRIEAEIFRRRSTNVSLWNAHNTTRIILISFDIGATGDCRNHDSLLETSSKGQNYPR